MAVNWRKPVIQGLLGVTSPAVLQELRLARAIERNPDEVRRVQDRRLRELLRHAWTQTDYYREVLSDSGVVRDGEVYPEHLGEVPFLTKDVLREQGARLRARELPAGRKAFVNRTGGSTGQPCEFWQDSFYDAGNIADKLYHFETLGKSAGEPEMKIWGAQRDLFRDKGTLTAKLKNLVYNRRIESCASLSDERIGEIIDHVNAFRPRLIWGYIDGMYAVADHALRKNRAIVAPAAVFCGGGTFFPHMAEVIERAFGCPAINYYGSREMGAVACQCRERAGLHVTAHSHVVEVVDDDGRPVREEEGNLVLTSLTNYAMPFLRYWIGDRGVLTDEPCPCGRAFPVLRSVSGRAMESLVKPTGEIVSPIFLITKIGTSVDGALVKRIQIVQDEVSRVTLRLVPDPHASAEDVREHAERVATLLGEVMECDVATDLVEDIAREKSGKYLYTVCNLPKRARPETADAPAAYGRQQPDA